MQPEVWRCTPSTPDPPSKHQAPTARAKRALPPPSTLPLSLSKSPATCSGESTLSFAPLSFLLSDSTRAASMDSPSPAVSSAGCVPYDNSRQAHRPPEFITTFKVAAQRPRYLHLFIFSLSRRYMLSVYRAFHFRIMT